MISFWFRFGSRLVCVWFRFGLRLVAVRMVKKAENKPREPRKHERDKMLTCCRKWLNGQNRAVSGGAIRHFRHGQQDTLRGWGEVNFQEYFRQKRETL